jgi:hypothetical protein
MNEEHCEVIEGYIEMYALNEGLPLPRKKRAIKLINGVRQLRRLDFPNRNSAAHAVNNMSRQIAESRVFHSSEHAGYNQLLSGLNDSIDQLKGKLEEKFLS